MSLSEWILPVMFLLAGAALGAALGRWLAARKLAKQMNGNVEDIRKQLDENVRCVLADQAALKAERDDQADRADRYFKVIEDIERERNEWAERCRAAIVGHSAAQDLMMSDNARLLRRLEAVASEAAKEAPDATKIRRLAHVRPDPTLEQLAEQYKAEHGPVVDQAAAAQKAGQGQQRARNDDQKLSGT